MQITIKPGIGASRHFCQMIISHVVWVLKHHFLPADSRPFPLAAFLVCTNSCFAQPICFFPSPCLAWCTTVFTDVGCWQAQSYLLASVELERAFVAGCLLATQGMLLASGGADLGAHLAGSASGSREVWKSWWSVLLAQGFSLSRLFASSSSNGTFCSAPIVSLGTNKPSRHLSWRLWHSNCFNGKRVPAQEACCHQSFL